MNDISDDTKQRLRFKTVSTILIGAVSTVLFGILLYLLPIFVQTGATLAVIFLLFLVIGLSSSYFLKTPKLFTYNILIVPLSPLITLFLNIVHAQYTFQNLADSLPGDAFLLLFFTFFLSFFLITPVTRICLGYESRYDPIPYSYVVEGDANDDFRKRLRGLIGIAGGASVSFFTDKDLNLTTLEFFFMKDRYLAYLRPRANAISELDFLVFRLKRDTIIPPEKCNVDLFFSLFDAAAGKLTEQEKIVPMRKDNAPSFLQDIKNRFASSYTAPIGLPINIPRPRIGPIKSWTNRHTAILGFIGGIVATVISALILRYIFGI